MQNLPGRETSEHAHLVGVLVICVAVLACGLMALLAAVEQERSDQLALAAAAVVAATVLSISHAYSAYVRSRGEVKGQCGRRPVEMAPPKRNA